MCPSRLNGKIQGDFYRTQRGSSLIIAVFIIVVMAVLATSLNKNIASSSSQVNYEVLGTRALLASEAGNEAMLTQLFPIDGSGAICPVGTQQRYLTTAGLNQCTVASTCSETTIEGKTYYSIVSTGVCKVNFVGDNSNPNLADANCTSSDALCVSRTVEVEAKTL